MREVTQPVSIEGIEVDALISEKQAFSSDVPEYPIETGVTVTDTIINKALEVQMVVCVSNTPVTWLDEHGVSDTRVDDVQDMLEELWRERKIITIETSFKTYENMVIVDMVFEKTLEMSNARDITITFRQISVTETDTAEVPSDYEKVGETMASVGTANTKNLGGGSGKSSGTSSGGNGGYYNDYGDVLDNTIQKARGWLDDSILYRGASYLFGDSSANSQKKISETNSAIDSELRYQSVRNRRSSRAGGR